MCPTPAQLVYIALMLYQLRLNLVDALYLARLETEAQNLWMLEHRDALRLICFLEHLKQELGFPQVHLR